jgi:hypothetical protein
MRITIRSSTRVNPSSRPFPRNASIIEVNIFVSSPIQLGL